MVSHAFATPGDAYHQLMAGYAPSGEKVKRSAFVVRTSSLPPHKTLSSACAGVEALSDVEAESSTETLGHQPHPVKLIGPNHFAISSSPEMIQSVSMQNLSPDLVMVDVSAVQDARARMLANKQRVKAATSSQGKSPYRNDRVGQIRAVHFESQPSEENRTIIHKGNTSSPKAVLHRSTGSRFSHEYDKEEGHT